jgi:hypothetical protein
MDGDLSGPEPNSPDQSAVQAGDGAPRKRKVIDWFALTEDNLAPQEEAPPAPGDAPTLEVPTACSIGGLRP